ncbi:MAG: hypothetical protein ABGY71_15505 [bacterium]|nr:hypothetical protein [Planctomycetota bacterium]
MFGKRSPQIDLFRPDKSLASRVGPNPFYGFMARHGSRMFRDKDFADDLWWKVALGVELEEKSVRQQHAAILSSQPASE